LIAATQALAAKRILSGSIFYLSSDQNTMVGNAPDVKLQRYVAALGTIKDARDGITDCGPVKTPK
jgi:hypothetical protein